MVLSGIDQVPWASIQHAYGAATDVPPLLERIAAAKPKARADAVDELGNLIAHQGTLYEATSFVVPFLIELAAHSDEESAIALLSCVITALSARPCAGDPGEAWLAATRAAAATGCPVYLRYLGSANPQLRVTAAALLSWFPTHAEHRPAILKALSRESHPAVQCTLLWAVTALTGQDERAAWTEELRSRMNGPAGPVAAACTAYLEGAAASDQTYRKAAEVNRSEPINDVWPWLPDELRLEALLEKLPAERKVEALGAALAQEEHFPEALQHAAMMLRIAYRDQRQGWDDYSFSRRNADGSTPPRASLLRMLLNVLGTYLSMRLRMAFGMKPKPFKIDPSQRQYVEFYAVKEPPEPAGELSILQQRTLQLLTDNELLWQGLTNLWELFNLPSDRSSLRALVR